MSFTGFLFIWILHIVSFIVAFIINRVERKKGIHTAENEREKKSPVALNVWLGLIAIYLLIRWITGWKIQGWYGEALIILIVFVLFDILVIGKRIYGKRILRFYTAVRGIFFVSMVIRLLITFFLVLMMSPVAGFILPVDKSYGEQRVYHNIYIYRNDEQMAYVFKKKIGIFEKDIAKVKGDITMIGIHGGDPVTGYVYKDGDDTNKLYILGSLLPGEDFKQSWYISVTILPGTQHLRIDLHEAEESHFIKEIKYN